jgi:hypothetical protein
VVLSRWLQLCELGMNKRHFMIPIACNAMIMGWCDFSHPII